jgi:hypothetical protein
MFSQQKHEPKIPHPARDQNKGLQHPVSFRPIQNVLLQFLRELVDEGEAGGLVFAENGDGEAFGARVKNPGASSEAFQMPKSICPLCSCW